MSKMALEALVPIQKPPIRSLGQRNNRRRSRAKKRLSTWKNYMLSMHESRKSVSSASVIWYTILFRQNRTDRPIRGRTGILTKIAQSELCF